MAQLAIVLCLVLALLAGPASASGSSESTKLVLATIEGVVVNVDEHEGEGGLPTLAVAIKLATTGKTRTVLLAPRSSCEEIGFDVEAGDRLRARIFVDADGPAKAHKALNLTRDTMIRFRTLRSVPLWTATGAWQGGRSRAPQGGRRVASPGPPGGRAPAGSGGAGRG